MRNQPEYWRAALFFSLMMLTVSRMAPAQILGPPIHGFNGTIAPADSIDKFYDGLNTGLSALGDGIDRATHHKGTVRGVEASLDGLRPGIPVSVQYVVKGIETSPDATDLDAPNAEQNEGTIATVDRSARRISIRFSDGTIQTLRAADAADADNSRVIVYRSGDRVPHYFKPARH